MLTRLRSTQWPALPEQRWAWLSQASSPWTCSNLPRREQRLEFFCVIHAKILNIFFALFAFQLASLRHSEHTYLLWRLKLKQTLSPTFLHSSWLFLVVVAWRSLIADCCWCCWSPPGPAESPPAPAHSPPASLYFLPAGGWPQHTLCHPHCQGVPAALLSQLLWKPAGE